MGAGENYIFVSTKDGEICWTDDQGQNWHQFENEEFRSRFQNLEKLHVGGEFCIGVTKDRQVVIMTPHMMGKLKVKGSMGIAMKLNAILED